MSKSIRNVGGETSAYFGGGYRQYGKYQWCVKLRNIDFYDHEVEALVDGYLGLSVKLKGTRSNRFGFEVLNDLLGREVEAGFAGRSGGRLVINDDLSEEELAKLDYLIADALKRIPETLKEIREEAREEARLVAEEMEREELATKAALLDNPKIQQALKNIEEVAGCDATLTIKGIKLL